MFSKDYLRGFIKTALDYSQYGHNFSGYTPKAPIDIRHYGPELAFGYKDMEDAYATRYGMYGAGIGALTGGLMGARKRSMPMNFIRRMGLKARMPLKAATRGKLRGVLGLAGLALGA